MAMKPKNRTLSTGGLYPLLRPGKVAIELLIEWLNTKEKDAYDAKVQYLVQEMNEIDTLARSKEYPDCAPGAVAVHLHKTLRKLGFDPTVATRVKKIRSIYTRFRLTVFPGFPFRTGWGMGLLYPGGIHPRKYQLRFFKFWTSLAIIYDLAADGRLRRVRKCETCGRWFFAYRPDKRFRFCPDPDSRCREKHWRGTDAGKAKRREFQRGYRSRRKKKEKAELEAANKPMTKPKPKK